MIDWLYKLIFKKAPTKTQRSLLIFGLVIVALIIMGSRITAIKDYVDLDKLLQGELAVKQDKVTDLIEKKLSGALPSEETMGPGASVGTTTDNTDYIGKFLVTNIIDGDTIELAGGERVRYIGLDAPELDECYYAEATTQNRELVGGEEVRLEKDKSDRDKYGRLLRYIYVENVLINEVLVKQGYARAKTYEPDITKQAILDQAGRDAESQGLGLWQACEADSE